MQSHESYELSHCARAAASRLSLAFQAELSSIERYVASFL